MIFRFMLPSKSRVPFRIMLFSTLSGAMLSTSRAADFFPKFGWILDVITGLHMRLEEIFRDLDVFYERLIDEHIDPARLKLDHQDIIDILLGISPDETAPIPLSRNNMKSILMDILIGTTGRSSVTVVWTTTELARNPRATKKVQAEIRSLVGRKPKVSEQEVSQLKYLKNVVKETFRLYPPITLLLPRESIRPCTIGGYEIPAKTRIHVNAWAIGRDPETWKNPEEFYPERFEESDVHFKGNQYELIPFGARQRICPSMIIGTTAVEFTLANLLDCFDWVSSEGMSREDINVEKGAGLCVHKKDPPYLVPIKYDWH